MNFKNWNSSEFMLDFMGLFYIVFSFFKMLDLKGFPESFKMYDPLAKRLPIWKFSLNESYDTLEIYLQGYISSKDNVLIELSISIQQQIEIIQD